MRQSRVWSKNQCRCCWWAPRPVRLGSISIDGTKASTRPGGDSRHYDRITQAHRPCPQRDHLPAGTVTMCMEKNYISVTQSDMGKELAEGKAVPSGEPASASPFPGRKRRRRKCARGLLRRRLMATDMPLGASLLSVVPAISVLGQGQ